MVPAPTGLPTTVVWMPARAFCSTMPSMSARLGGIGNRLNSSGEVTWPWMSIVMIAPSALPSPWSGPGWSEHLAAVRLDRGDHVGEVGEVGRVERRDLQPFGRFAGVEE